jgi:hypothetical protein
MAQRIVALTRSVVIPSDATSPGCQYNIYVAPRLATFVLSIAACSTNSRNGRGGWAVAGLLGGGVGVKHGVDGRHSGWGSFS